MSSGSKGALFRPWLWLPSQWAHDLAPFTLPLLSYFFKPKNKTYRSFDWRGLHFKNPLGIAGGVDKSGQCLASWQRLGVGFLEVGTVTPEPQGPNPGKIMDREIRTESLWNKMGFPNPGARALARRLENFAEREVPLFINIGKNRWTSNDQAFEDYGQCIEVLRDFADAFVVNVSSPNTKGLRDLLSEAELTSFLKKLREKAQVAGANQPLLLKLSPDMEPDRLKMALQNSNDFVDGWILTNTTQSRRENSPFPKDSGGVSGRPLQALSRQALAIAKEIKDQNPEKLLISVGGVDSADEIQQRLNGGADLVQVYSALVFTGPVFFAQSLLQLQAKNS